MAHAQWRIAGASVAGVSHVRTGLPCQDAHAFRLLSNGMLIAGVADGAGSASLAETGAQIAVQSGVSALVREAEGVEGAFGGENGVDETMPRAALQAARAALEAEAAIRNTPLRELATTLLLAVVDAGKIAAVQVGDGAIVGLDATGGVFAVTVPPEAEYANATTFLTSPDALQSAQIVIVERDLCGLALFSDGLQRLALKLPEGVPHAPFFTPLFRFMAEMKSEKSEESEVGRGEIGTNESNPRARQLEAFLRSPRIMERADDDLTLLLAVR